MPFKKFPSIEQLGSEENEELLKYDDDEIIVEEKIDGGNGSFWLEEDGIHFGSRNRDLTAEGDSKTFEIYQAQLRKHLEGKQLNDNFYYYHEWMQMHTIKYYNAPFIIGLDIRLKHSMKEGGEFGLFLDRDAKEKEFQRLGLEVVPLVWRGLAKDLRKLNIQELIPKSKYYDGIAEGLVLKNYNRKSKIGNHQIFAKLVRQEFKEENRAVFGSIKNKSTDTMKVVEVFATEPRIKKQIHYLLNEEGMKLELALMQHLPTNVIKDILKEEIFTIYGSYKSLDFKEMRQLVNPLCLRVIKQMMLEKSVG